MVGLKTIPPLTIICKANFSTIGIISPHQIEIMFSRKSNVGAVGRVGSPRLSLFCFKGVAFYQFTTVHMVFKLNTVYMKCEKTAFGIVVKIVEVKVFGIKPTVKCFAELCRHIFIIKKRAFGFFIGINIHPALAVAIFPLVPENIFVFDPVGSQECAAGHILHIIGSKPFGKFKVRLYLRRCKSRKKHRENERSDDGVYCKQIFHTLLEFIEIDVGLISERKSIQTSVLQDLRTGW